MANTIKRLAPALVLGLFAVACEQSQPVSPDSSGGPEFHNTEFTPLSGAIFTTTVDGAIVNENVRYEAKEDVYLDGGPGPNAPSTAAGLPAGDYYFQVTDPSGKDLLSTDHISCRQIHVNENGVIDFVYSGTNVEKQQGTWTEVDCKHEEGVDIDHPELGAITVQLFPYDDTPNPGGVYKAWVTRVEDYEENYVGPDPLDCVGQKGQCNVNGEGWEPGNAHGFVPHHSKTDNYKVKQKGPKVEPPEITVKKFHDKNLNGVWDEGEEWVEGWRVDYTTPVDGGFDYTEFVLIAAEPGDYVFTEETPGGTLQTVSLLDDVIVSAYPIASSVVAVTITADYSMKADQELHTIIYGNVGLGQVTACKYYDANGNGEVDPGEEPVEGVLMQLIGDDVTGAQVSTVQATGPDGCTTFTDLRPGAYTVTESVPSGAWVPSGATVSDVFTIESTLSGATMTGGSFLTNFTNFCEATADFGTKGYWHNKNGLEEITDDDIAYVNGLLPYSSPSSYFGAGDEPFDGFFSNGDPVAEAYNNEKITDGIAAGEGTARAEISHFLTDANAGGDPREQLAQQLLAFIFNARNRLGGTGVAIWDGSEWVTAQSLIEAAIAAWESGTDAERTAIKDVLDAYNNSDAVTFISPTPCSIVYP
jgi:hypothetical protein